MSRFHRLRQVTQYGWKHAGQISKEYYSGNKRIPIFIDILKCYRKYSIWSNQYLREKFWQLEKEQRDSLGCKYREANLEREAWVRAFYNNRSFFIKYGDVRYEKESLREHRNKAYAKQYNAGENFVVEYDVNISRQHYLNGIIRIGRNCLLAKHVSIDYTGDVVLEDNVKIADGVSIESHRHEFIPGETKAKTIPTKIIIEDGVSIFQKSVICEGVGRIGRRALIGAGCVVRKTVPPYAIVIGNPARIVGFRFTPDQVLELEEEMYPEDKRITENVLRDNYKKYYLDRIIEIKEFLK